MNVTIANTYHERHAKQAMIINTYYRKLGYKVDSYVADFKETPEHECRNGAFDHNPDSDYILHLDSDEIMLPDDLQCLYTNLCATKFDAYRCGLINYIAADTIANSNIHKPIVAVKNNAGIRFTNNRNLSGCKSWEEVPIKIHHLGYCLDYQWKLNNYKERKEYHEIGVVQSIVRQDGVKVVVPKEVKEIMGELCLK